MNGRPENNASQTVPGIPQAPGPALLPELAHWLATARRELARHVRDHDRCAECGRTWPCEQATLAAFTFDAL